MGYVESYMVPVLTAGFGDAYARKMALVGGGKRMISGGFGVFVNESSAT